jgi:hypothetical protein
MPSTLASRLPAALDVLVRLDSALSDEVKIGLADRFQLKVI